jgi:hypothetical protein
MSVRHVLSVAVCCVFLSSTGFAQTDRSANANHTFPQIADGKFSDGSYYKSSVIATSVTAGVTSCTLTLNGLPANRLAGGVSTFDLTNTGAYTVLQTTGDQPIASGYASLSCTRPVTAFVVYEYFTPGTGLASTATVFSSQAGSLAQFTVDQRIGSRFAFAIANDTNTSALFQLIAYDAAGVQVGQINVSIAGKSNRALFLDEFVRLPSAFLGSLLIGSTSVTSPAGPPFSVIGLSFGCCSSLFTTIPATVLAP